MKNRHILLALVLSTGFFATSCSSDDNGGETLAPLTGKWNLSKVGTEVSGQEVLNDAPQNQSGCNKDYLELKIDNTVMKGDYYSAVSPCDLDIDAGIYSRSHNDLTTAIDGVTKTQDILNLKLHELKLKDANGVITVYTR